MNLSYITDQYLKTYSHRLNHPEEINYGDCYKWAHLAHRLHGGQLITVTTHIEIDSDEPYQQESSHAFLRYGNKYYDSEAPEGLDNWEELCYFAYSPGSDVLGGWYYDLRSYTSAAAFRRYWGFNRKELKADQKLYLKLLSKQRITA